jgi:polysaccharide deacetylase 2 family uncharacterized protein YibQ
VVFLLTLTTNCSIRSPLHHIAVHYSGENMTNNNVAMERREFLLKSAAFLAGSLLGLNCYSKAFGQCLGTGKPRIALIIDDIGFSHTRLQNFLKIGAPLTFSILPRLDKSRPFAEEIHHSGHEIMLHQPMEPLDPNIDPGPGAIYVGDSHEKIIDVIGQNISDTPHIAGINNHMGSRFTSRGKEMEDALRPIKEQRLFFVDSLTTSHSKGYRTARKMNIYAAFRNIFLDNKPDKSLILLQLNKLKMIALSSGYAIGIGHPHPETAQAIKLFYEKLKKTNIKLASVSSLIQIP